LASIDVVMRARKQGTLNMVKLGGLLFSSGNLG
jgi:hypothetical protein